MGDVRVEFAMEDGWDGGIVGELNAAVVAVAGVVLANCWRPASSGVPVDLGGGS